MKKDISTISIGKILILIIGIFSISGISFAVNYQPTTSSSINNASPVITVTPSDNGSSVSAMTNEDSNVTFTATAKDVNSNQYYLIICKTDAVTAGNNTAPSCPGGQWAVSAATNSNSQATATHTAASSDAVTNEWYAFVCDRISSVASCLPANGLGDRGFALGTITFSNIPADGDTITVDSVTYEFDTAGNGVSGGNTSVNTSNAESASESASLLASAEIGALTHMYARANIIYVYANSFGVSGNAIGMSKSSSVINLSGTNLAGGNDSNASPFYVNHRGTFGSVVVTDTGNSSTLEPGDLLKFKLPQGSITETSNVNMFICTSATTSFNYATNTCVGGSLVCSSLNVDPTSADAVCQESSAGLVPVPTSHGSKNYKVYVEDMSDLGAVGTNTQSYTVADVRPLLGSYVTTPVPGTLVAASYINYAFTVTLTDDNGDNDVTNVQGMFFDKSVVAHSCTASDNNCIINSSCDLNNVNGGADNTLTASCQFQIWYNANASDWDVEAMATDGTGVTQFVDAGVSLTIGALSAFTVTQGSISYGTVGIGFVSNLTPTTIANMGNQVMDILIDGDNMVSGGNSILLTQQKWYHINSDFNWNSSVTAPGPYTLVDVVNQGCTAGVDCGDAQGCLNRDIAVRTDHNSSATNENIYWKLRIPDTQPTGTYTGSNTFSSAISSTCAGGQSY